MKDDLISRQAAIEAFWKLEVEVRPRFIDAMLNMLDSLPGVTREQKWILLTDRLPDENTEFLGQTKWGSITVCYRAECCGTGCCFFDSGSTNGNLDELVAWMPLPEPYRGDNAEPRDTFNKIYVYGVEVEQDERRFNQQTGGD